MRRRFGRGRRKTGTGEGRNAPIDAELWLGRIVESQIADGVRLDKRAVFGSAHLPDLFQRISALIVAYASRRIRAYDAAHPYTARRRAWSERRRRATGSSRSVARVTVVLVTLLLSESSVVERSETGMLVRRGVSGRSLYFCR